MRTRAPNQGVNDSFGYRNDKNSTILSQTDGVSNDDRLLPSKIKAKPAAMTSLNFYSSKGTTART